MSRRDVLRRGALAALLLVAGSSAAAATAAKPTLYVMRHLNTPAGADDPDLTAEGERAAAALVRWFRGKPLAAIYISDFKRTRQTARPLAAKRRLTPKLYDPADTPALLARVKAEGAPVLIVGHSNTVPDIVEQLGGPRPAPLTHPDFGDIWTIAASGTTRGKIVP